MAGLKTTVLLSAKDGERIERLVRIRTAHAVTSTDVGGGP